MGGSNVHELCKDARFNRGILDRIAGLAPDSLNGRFALQFTITTYDLHTEWLMYQAVFLFTVDGKRTLTGRCKHAYGSSDEPCRYAEFEFRNPETKKEEELGSWDTLTIVIRAGKEEKRFEVTKPRAK